jgi:hypothetical protein
MDNREFWIDFRQRQAFFILPMLILALGLNHPSIQKVPGTAKWPGREGISHLYQESTLRMSGTITPPFSHDVHSGSFYYLENIISETFFQPCFF